MSDVFPRASGRRPRVTFSTWSILLFTAWTTVGGAVLRFVADPAIAQLPGEERLQVAWFQRRTAATRPGFNTSPTGRLGQESVLLMGLRTVTGASPSGTGAGLRSSSLSAIGATLQSTLNGRHRASFFGALFPTDRLRTAFAALAMDASTPLLEAVAV